MLLAVQKQINGLVAERDALKLQVDGLVAERDILAGRCAGAEPVRVATGNLIDEAERAIMEEQQTSGRTFPGLQWAVDQARMALGVKA